MYRILIVEDNEDMSFGLSANFAHEGWTPVTSTTGKGALEHIHELIERIRTVGRRAFPASPDINRADGQSPVSLRVSVARREVTWCGVAIHLKPKEFDLLICLIRAGGSLVPKQKILQEVWQVRQKLATRTVDSTYYALKNALERGGVPAGAIRSANRQGLAWTYRALLE